MHENTFAVNDLSNLLPLSVHDAVLAGDTLTTLTLNYEWRVFITAQLESLLEYNKYRLSEADYDVLNQVYLDMMLDLYS